MNSEILLAEAESLIRRSHLLVPGAGEVVGYWHGLTNSERCIVVRLGDKWIDVNTASAQEVDTPAVLDVPLVITPHDMLPPIDAVFAKGSDAIGDWLSECNWERNWGYNDNFAGRELVYEYERRWQQNFPLYTRTAHAVIGGWHFPWPDDDWHDLLDCELVLWTLAESEPWIEVWKQEGKYFTIERIT